MVYVWETSELAILWLNPRKTAAFVDPKIGSKMLAKAKSITPEELFALVGRLQTLAK